MKSINRLCLTCQKKLHGRIDKKFCNDFCRNHYNNQLHPDRDDYVRFVHTILRKNRRILVDIMKPFDTSVNISRQKLLDKGYNFSFFTNQLQTQRGLCTFCYEFGILPLEDQCLQVVKQKV